MPLYDSLGENAIEFIINHSEATVVFVASDKAANLAKALPMCKERLKAVVIWGPKDAGVTAVRAPLSRTPSLGDAIRVIASRLLQSAHTRDHASPDTAVGCKIV